MKNMLVEVNAAKKLCLLEVYMKLCV